MNNKLIAAIVVIILIVLGGFWYAQKDKVVTPATGEPIKIGAVISMTGAAAATGEYAEKALRLAEEEINADGGIDGRPVEIVIEDDATDPTKAVTAFNKVVEVDGVEAVIGSLWDFTTQPLLPLALTKQVALVSPTNFRITGSFDLNDQSFVMLSDFNKVIAALEDYLKDSGAEKVAVVRYNSGFGAEIAKTLDTVMTSLGKGKVMDESYNTLGGNDFGTTVLKLKTAGVDTVFIDALDIDTLNFLQRSKELGFQSTIITHVLILDALQNADVDKSLLENVVVLNWETTSDDFIELFSAKYDVAPAKSADKVYDAVYVLAEAIAKAESKDKVAEYLAGNDFETVNGNIRFTADHAVEETPVRIQIIKNGELTDI